MAQPYESAVDRAIREAAERGAFDDLPGRGKPLPQLDDPSEDWWLRGYLRREGISGDLLLPPSVALRKEIDRLPGSLDELRSESDVRELIAAVNTRVVRHLRFPEGPRVPLRPVDVEAAVGAWRARRARPAPAGPAPGVARPVEPSGRPGPARRRWWRRP